MWAPKFKVVACLSADVMKTNAAAVQYLCFFFVEMRSTQLKTLALGYDWNWNTINGPTIDLSKILTMTLCIGEMLSNR